MIMTAWKFPINFASKPDFSKEEIRSMVKETAGESDGRVIVRDDMVYLTLRQDAFSFRMRAGDLVHAGKKGRVKA